MGIIISSIVEHTRDDPRYNENDFPERPPAPAGGCQRHTSPVPCPLLLSPHALAQARRYRETRTNELRMISVQVTNKIESVNSVHVHLSYLPLLLLLAHQGRAAACRVCVLMRALPGAALAHCELYVAARHKATSCAVEYCTGQCES